MTENENPETWTTLQWHKSTRNWSKQHQDMAKEVANTALGDDMITDKQARVIGGTRIAPG